MSLDQGWKVAVGRTARGSITLIPDFLLTMYRSGSEVADSEDTGAIYSAEREKYEHRRSFLSRLLAPSSSTEFTFA